MYINPLEIIQRIGQAPIGDPAAMSRHAAQLRSEGDRIAGLAGSVSARARAMAYEGPAADRFRTDVDANVREAAVAAGRLHDAASALQRAAGAVATAQAHWQQRFRQVEAELIAAARAAGRR
jgi:hypothetical protein